MSSVAEGVNLIENMINLFFSSIAFLGFSVCLARALWVWFQPGIIPDIIRRMPLLTFRGQPNRTLTVIVFLLGALACLVGIAIRMRRLLDDGNF